MQDMFFYMLCLGFFIDTCEVMQKSVFKCVIPHLNLFLCLSLSLHLWWFSLALGSVILSSTGSAVPLSTIKNKAKNTQNEAKNRCCLVSQHVKYYKDIYII